MHTKDEPKSDFVIITPLIEECRALLSKLPGWTKLPSVDNSKYIYYRVDLPITSLDNRISSYRIIVVSPGKKGQTSANNAAIDAISHWHPRFIMIVGIAGGVAANNIHVGDIIFPQKIAGYDLQKEVEEGTFFEWETPLVDFQLWNARMNFEDENWQKMINIPHPISGKSAKRNGTIASGNKVIKNVRFLNLVRKSFSDLIGTEMEANSVAKTCSESNDKPGFFMIRSISDLADRDKNTPIVEKCRPFACHAVAAFTVAFLKNRPVPPLNLGITKVELSLERIYGELSPEEKHEFLEYLSIALKIDKGLISTPSPLENGERILLELSVSATEYLNKLAVDKDRKIISLGIKSIRMEGGEDVQLAEGDWENGRFQKIKIPFVTVALNRDEAEDLRKGFIFDESVAEKERLCFFNFRKLLEEKYPNWHERYHEERDSWQPHSFQDTSTGEFINTRLNNVNYSLKENYGTAVLFGISKSEDAFNNNMAIREDAWKFLKEWGGIMIIDAVSLFHPALQKELVQSGIIEHKSVAILVISPENPSEYKLNQIINKLIENNIRQSDVRNKEPDILCEIGVGNSLAVQRWFAAAMPETVERIQTLLQSKNIGRIRNEWGSPPKIYKMYFLPRSKK